jgi:hypothetical protein
MLVLSILHITTFLEHFGDFLGGLKFTFGFNGGQLFQRVSLLKKLGKGAPIWGVKKKIEEERKNSKWGQ